MSEEKTIQVERKRASSAGACLACNSGTGNVLVVTIGDARGSQTVRLCYECWNRMLTLGSAWVK